VVTMLLPTKGIDQDRALLSVGATILGLLTTPTTVSGLWERFSHRPGRKDDAPTITFDWFVLALDMLYTMGVIRWNESKQLEACHVPV